MPDEDVGIAPGPLHVLHERIEPQHLAGEVVIGCPAERIEATEPGRKSTHPQFEPRARLEQILGLGVGFAARYAGSSHARTSSGVRKPSRRANSPMIDECEAPLPGAAKLHHVRAEVVRRDDGRQRPALPQRGHVPVTPVTCSSTCARLSPGRAAAQVARTPGAGPPRSRSVYGSLTACAGWHCHVRACGRADGAGGTPPCAARHARPVPAGRTLARPGCGTRAPRPPRRGSPHSGNLRRLPRHA